MRRSQESWDRGLAAHLARRAGFGATPQELDRLVALGRKKAIASFVNAIGEDAELEREMQEIGGTLTDLGDVEGANLGTVANRARGWWFYRMVRTSQPLREKMVLFWHDHFATKRSKILRLPMYLGQNEVLREHALGSFRELLFAVAADAGMLRFLDNRLSDARNPNENWGRELLELFTLGVDNGYQQTDVYEMARVFTGWTTPDLNSPDFLYDPSLHDTKDKTLFGKTIRGRDGKAGMDEGYEAMELILEKHECSAYLATKLVQWFVSHEPNPEFVSRIAEVLRDSGYSIRATLTAIFDSDEFFAPENRSTLFKNPAEFVVSACRLLELQNAHLADLPDHARTLGMDLFEPPSVAGWEHGASWVNSNSTVARTQFALRMSTQATSPLHITGSTAFDLKELMGTASDDESLIDTLAQRLYQEDFPEKAAIAQYLAQLDTPPQWTADRVLQEKARATIHLLLSSPRFALA